MTPEMEFECLLVSRDPELYLTINKVLRNFSISVDHCRSSSSACDLISKGSHDLVVIDWEGEASSELLHTIWRLQNKKKPTTLAISEDGGSIPGAHLTLSKPVTSESGTGSIKAAYSRMLLDYRIHARYAVMTSVSARDENGRTLRIIVTDIGEGGIGLKSEQLSIGTLLFFSIHLPETRSPLHVQARVIWTRDYGTAGCEIVNIPPVDREILRAWLKAKTLVKKPLVTV